jgi:hypothetical protein
VPSNCAVNSEESGTGDGSGVGESEGEGVKVGVSVLAGVNVAVGDGISVAVGVLVGIAGAGVQAARKSKRARKHNDFFTEQFLCVRQNCEFTIILSFSRMGSERLQAQRWEPT